MGWGARGQARRFKPAGFSFGFVETIGPERVVILGGVSFLRKDTQMLFRKTIIALCGVAAFGLLLPTVAAARPGGHGGGGGARAALHGGGGGGGGLRGGGGGFRGGSGFGGAGIVAGAVGLGLGLAAAPYGYGGYGYSSGYDSYAYDDGGCYLVRQRVMTPYGWRLRRVQVCD
jgi:hypothetical protein